MRTNYFKQVALAILTAGLIFISCSDSSDEVENKGQPEGDYGYISFSLINSSVSGVTKAEVYGTADENKVNSALIVLYDGDTPATSVVKYQIKLTNIGEPSAPGDDMHSISPGTSATTYRTKAQRIEKKDYKLAVFINPPGTLEGFTEEDDKLEDMQAVATITVNGLTQRTVESSTYTDNFLMGNFAGLVDVDENDIWDTEDEAVAAPVKVDVERAVAKVSLSVDGDIEDNSTTLAATIGDIYWDVDVINTKTFWMRQTAATLDGTNEGTANREKMYATDPNMSGQSRLGDKSETLSSEFVSKYGPIDLPFDGADEDLAAYVSENTMVAAEQWEDVTTTVLISAVITPTRTFFSPSFTSTEPYFLYRNKVFTLTDIQEIYAAYNTPETTITSAGEIWEDIIKETDYADIIALPAILEAIKSNFGNNYASFTLTTSQDVYHANGTVSYFAAGAPNYYYVPIRHFSNTQQPDAMAYGRYGVVRNNWYNLTLNSINSYGTAEVPKLEDRLDPDDKEGNWLSIEFKILPWMQRNQGVDL